MRYVLDCSVALKWVLAEVDSHRLFAFEMNMSRGAASCLKSQCS
jgi:hypothetical protein